jgi:hypothetical protein
MIDRYSTDVSSESTDGLVASNTTPTMTTIGKPERSTQDRIIALFRDDLGYRNLGDWSDRTNSNIEEDLLSAYLAKAGYAQDQIDRAIFLLKKEAENPNHCCSRRQGCITTRL